MGCVLGKRSAGDNPAPREASSRRRPSSDESSVAVTKVSSNGIQLRKDAEHTQSNRSCHTEDFPATDPRRTGPDPCLRTPPRWPSWLVETCGDAIKDWTPRRANTFEKLDKIGQGTYSNVYKARDLITGKIVALKKVRFDTLEPESVKFMAREILILRKLDHPNVIKLEGLVTSRMSCSLYLVFEYMEHDLAGLVASQGVKFSEPQVKCYMKQLLSGLEHCHNRGVLHRDIKGSNLLIDNDGILKIADFGLATFYDTHHKQPMTSRVVTLWYRAPELLLGASYYDVGVDLWSAGCILAELLAGKPIMPGRTEVEQLHKIFKLCGSPSEEYWKKSRLPNATLFKPQHPYKRCVAETFKEFPPSVPLIESLLAIEPSERGTATAALNSEFFTTEPYACDPSSFPKYPPSKEINVKLRDEEARRQRSLNGKAHAADGCRKVRVRDRAGRAIPAPEANAEIQANLDRWRVMAQTNAKSKSEKFPPPHQDGAVGPVSFGAGDASFSYSIFNSKSLVSVKSSGTEKTDKGSNMGSNRKFLSSFKPLSIGQSIDQLFKGKSAEVFGNRKEEKVL